ncbi:hypothetical protein BT93_B2888 [Corymbia citriodora subsp. variegata]|nr:hypothetical protein BT93_B2888 [Corymbia citriodora subsp. variegata]
MASSLLLGVVLSRWRERSGWKELVSAGLPHPLLPRFLCAVYVECPAYILCLLACWCFVMSFFQLKEYSGLGTMWCFVDLPFNRSR